MSRDETIPSIDLRFLSSDREKLLDELKHALMDYGFFYITNYDEYLDQNIIIALTEEANQFFELPEDEKNSIAMVNSKHFLGYNGLEKENTGGKVDWREQIDFCSTDKELDQDKITSVYDNLYGPNQYPSSEKLPFFKKSIEDFFAALNEFSILITKTIFDSIKVKDQEAAKYIDFEDPQNQFAKMKAIHYPANEVLIKSGKDVTDQGCGPHKDSDFLTFLFQPTLKEESLQVQNLCGDWINASPKPNTIICSVGQTLEYLTDGVCISSIHRVVTPKNQSRISIPYFQNVKLDSKLKPFILPPKLLKERDERDKLKKQTVDFQFKPQLDEPVSKSLFYNRIKAHRDVSEKWYPKILKDIDQELSLKKEKNENAHSLEIPELPLELERLKKIFTAFDNILIMQTINHTADIKLYTLVPHVKNLTQFNVELQDFLQIAFIWPEFTGLKIDDHDDYIVDLDETKDKMNFQNIIKRQKIFEGKLMHWYQENYSKWNKIPILDKKTLKTKSLSSMILKRARTEILQKSIKKQKKNESSSQLTLLQRIKKKEKERLDNQISPEEKYDMYLFDKLGQVLEIFTSLRPDLPHSLNGLTEQVVNSLSLTNALAQQEANDLILRLAKEFPNDFKLFEGKSTSVLKWKDFDVSEFKKKIKVKLRSNQKSK